MTVDGGTEQLDRPRLRRSPGGGVEGAWVRERGEAVSAGRRGHAKAASGGCVHCCFALMQGRQQGRLVSHWGRRSEGATRA